MGPVLKFLKDTKVKIRENGRKKEIKWEWQKNQEEKDQLRDA